jgi:hypothetical protein
MGNKTIFDEKKSGYLIESVNKDEKKSGYLIESVNKDYQKTIKIKTHNLGSDSL